MLKAYKYRMYPTKEQQKMFSQHFGACRFSKKKRSAGHKACPFHHLF
ncbi:MAG: helix-turn-helix domain-containing protein [Halobacteriota archaeon]